MKYFVFKVMAEEAGFIESYPRGSPTDWKFDRGISLAKDFPAGGEVSFSNNYPEDRNLYDFQPNLMSALLVSGRSRKLIESLGVSNDEWLPVVVKDHQGAIVGPDYAFLNLQGAEDAIDMERSNYEMNSIDKEQIGFIDKLALQTTAISPDAKMFRCTKERRLILIREDVHAAFEQAGLTGFKVYEAEGWDGLEL
ncbi:imm11 family protein [Myxococcus virescens]|uniref:MXAN_0049 family immunity protein n=1 Tax=Myxococcus virescens TaxID=83456 RepID=UPI003DA2E43B